MSSVRNRTAHLIVALAGLALPSLAYADPGDHVRLGELEIIPRLDIGLEYSSNVFRSDTNVQGGFDFLAEPGVAMSAKGDDHTFALTGYWQLRKYFKASQKGLDRYSDFGIGAEADLFKQSRVGLRLRDDMARNNRPVDRVGSSVGFNPQYRNNLEALVPVRLTPVLELRVGTDWLFHQVFTPDFNGGLREYNQRHVIGPEGELAWTFLPRTDLYVAGGYNWNLWAINWVTQDTQGNDIALPDSTTWRAVAGMRGRFTEHIIVLAELGYGQATYDEQTVEDQGGDGSLAPDDVRGLTGLLISASIGWQFGPREKVGVSYKRDFEDSFFTNYVAYDQGLVYADLRLGTRVGTHLGAKVRSERYAGFVTRGDLLFGADASGTYYFTDYLRAALDVSYDQRLSDAPGVPFQEFQAGLTVGFEY